MRIARSVLLVAVALAGLFAAGGYYTANSIAHGMIDAGSRKNRPPMRAPRDVDGVIEINRDGARIRGWVLDPNDKPRGTIVMLHGLRTNKLNLMSRARKQVRRGYRVVPCDVRGHGDSTGRHLTYGVEESKDLSAVVDRLIQRKLLVEPLIVIGSSYGASLAIEHAARDQRVDAVVALAPYASLREAVPPYLKFALGRVGASLMPLALVHRQIDAVAKSAGFDPAEACPRCVAPKIRVPALVIASRTDERIPYEQSVEIKDALGGPTELLLVNNTAHADLSRAPGVQSTIDRFVDATTDAHGGTPTLAGAAQER